jgi:hypothetical protein
MRTSLFFLPALFLTGCDVVGGCTHEAVPGLRIEARAADGTDLDADGVLGLAHDGSFVDTLEVFELSESILDFYGAYERAGRYDITVTKPGFETWRRTNVRVSEDECHVRTVTLEALLERE